MRNNSCAEGQIACVPLQSCLDTDAVCDYINDCPNASDEASICESFPQGSRCNFELDFCHWYQADAKNGHPVWGREEAGNSTLLGFVGYENLVDHTTGTRRGRFLYLHIFPTHQQEAISEFRSPVFPAFPQGYNDSRNSCKVRFYYMATGVMDNGIFLTVNYFKSSSLQHEIVWKYRSRNVPRSGWIRANVPLRNLHSPYFLRFWGIPGQRTGNFLIDDISLSSPCFSADAQEKTPMGNNNDDPFDLHFETSFTITTCGRSGPRGPGLHDCTGQYAALNQPIDFVPSDNTHNSTTGVQRWRVPITSIYNISAAGANGGGHNGCPANTASSLISLRTGEELLFLVGQEGESCTAKISSNRSLCRTGGGGGGTLVFKLDEGTGHAIPLIAAGGGGGSSSVETERKCVGRTVQIRSADLNVAAATMLPGQGGSVVRLFGNQSEIKGLRVEGATGSRYCAEAHLVMAAGGYGGGGAGCESFGGGGGGYEGGRPGTDHEPAEAGTSAVNLDYALAFSFWPSSDSLGGRVTITMVCNCSVPCRIRKGSAELYCPMHNEGSQNSLSQTDSLILLIVLGVLFFVGTVIGTSVCLYFGLRKSSAKRIHRKSRIWSCVSGSPEVNADPTLLQRLNNHNNIELNQLYGINAVHGYGDLKEIPKKTIQLKQSIGQGAFGIVYQGLMKTDTGLISVAVKSLPTHANPDAETDFAAEALIVSRFHHPNIVQCFGVSFAQNPKYIILELLSGGDVRSFLRSYRNSKTCTVTMLELLEISADIAKGCQYLEQHHFVHRDIAARNCLLTTTERSRVAKVADFGMARDVIRSEYYRRNTQLLLPIKWMPPEAVDEGIFSSKSDIWGFGVLLWEVFSLGCSPYSSMNNAEVVSYIRAGGRLNLPSSHCPPEIYDLMQDCWHKNPADRKSFSSIIRSLLGFMGLTSVISAPVPDVDAPPLPLLEINSSKMPVTDNPLCLSSTRSISLDRNSHDTDWHSGTKLLPNQSS
ncbi:ALK tyrosine kinase receptor-like isoform X2 [Paramacrobiotus metropolitanus]|nr:ALK tyrosine kinase receptor-like isoform X2 [Paramacrobiotus metropolitanus]